MAWLIADSFDLYAAVADAAPYYWDVSTNWALSATTRFGVGQSLKTFSGIATVLSKAIGSNEATWFAAVAHQQTSALSGTTAVLALQYLDGATAQCSVCFESGGNITLKSGGTSGSVLATYSSAFNASEWNQFQIKVVIDTAGSITIRKNGSPTDTWSATGLNTRGGTANTYATKFAVLQNPSATAYFDDLLVYSASGAAPNTWVGDIRALTLMPAADTAQKDFTMVASVVQDAQTSTVSNRSLSANTIYWSSSFAAYCTGTVGTVNANFNAGITGNVKAAIYTTSAGAPAALLATSNAIVNPATCVNTFTFASPPTVTDGEVYRIAYLSDTAWTSKASSSTTTYSESRTYGSGFTDPASASSTTAGSPYSTATITPTANYGLVNEALQDGDTTYVYSSTNGHEDLYDLADLTATPTSIVAVNSRMYAKKSDAGTRNAQLRVKSGATEVGGTDTAMNTVYSWLNRVDTVDPNTSAAWTAAAINALQVGPKVTA